MKFTIENGRVTVTLSKRNVLALLSKVDDPYSGRTLYNQNDPGWLIVKVEPDAEHYSGRTPGQVSEKSEAFIAGYGAKE